jgi:hypothetical protein
MAAYPRKQTVVIFAICTIAVGGVACYAYAQSRATNLTKDSGMQVSSLISSSDMPPADTEWQKQFLDTNIASAFKDDGHGTSSPKEEELSPTDQLGRNFFTKYTELKRSGLTADRQMVGNAMGQVAADTVNNLASPKAYSLVDLGVAKSGTIDLSTYGKSVLLTLRDYMPVQNEAEVASLVISGNDMSQLAKIDPIISSYKKLIAHLLKIPVPQPLAQYHLNLINGFSIGLFNSESLRHMDIDPMRGLAAISLEMVGVQNVTTALSGIQKYFVSAGVPLEL